MERYMEKEKTVSLANISIVSLGSLYYLYMFFVRVLPTVMTKELMVGFQASGSQVGMLITAFVCSYAFSQVPSGILIDQYGAKRVLILGMVGCFIGSYLFQATDNLWIAFLARAILGFSCGPAFIAPMSMVKHYLPERLFATAAGFIQVLGCVGAMLTQPVSELVTTFGFKEVILGSGIIAGFLGVLYCILPNDTPEITTKRGIPFKRAFLHMFVEPSFWLIGFLALASWAAIGGFSEAWGISYLSVLQDISIPKATSQMNWAWIGVAISSPLAGFWFENTENKIIPLFTMYAFGFFSMILLTTGYIESYYLISILLFILGCSAGAQPIAFKLISQIVPDNIHATAVSICNIFVIAGAFALQPLVSEIIERSWDGVLVDGAPYYQAIHYQLGFIPIIIVLFMAMIAACYSDKLGKLNEIS